MVNKITLVGNLGKDLNTTVMENGQVSTTSIATSKTWTDKKSGDKKSDTQWHNLVFWNGLSKIASKYLKKGSKIYVEGELTHRSYDDKEGVKRYISEIVVKDLKMLGDSKQDNNAQADNAPTPPEDSGDDLPF